MVFVRVDIKRNNRSLRHSSANKVHRTEAKRYGIYNTDVQAVDLYTFGIVVNRVKKCNLPVHVVRNIT